MIRHLLCTLGVHAWRPLLYTWDGHAHIYLHCFNCGAFGTPHTPRSAKS